MRERRRAARGLRRVQVVAAALSCASLLCACLARDDGGGASPLPSDVGRPAAVIPTGGFVDLTPDIDLAPPFPFDGLDKPAPEPTTGVFADLDGDGVPEVILSAFNHLDYPERRPAVYRQRDGALVLDPSIALPVAGQVLAAIDLDGDGLLDLLSSATPNNVAWGTAPGVFAPATDLTLGRQRLSTNRGGSGTLHFADVDGDGWLDVLLEGNGCCEDCHALLLLLRDGPRSFWNASALVDGTQGTWGGCSVGSLPIGPGEPLLFALGSSCDLSNPNLTPPVFFANMGVGDDGYPRFRPFDPLPTTSILKPPNRPHREISAVAPMGATVADFDGDGRQDLIVTLDPLLVLFTGQAGWPMADHSYELTRGLTEWNGNPVVLSDRGARQVPWSVAPLDLDLDGRPDLITTYGYDNDLWVGPEHNTVQLNRGNYRFEDITEKSGLNRRGEWHSLAVGDLDGDGRPDLVIGGTGAVPHVFRNELVTPYHGLAIRLRGTTSNHLGVGARVRVWPVATGPSQSFVAGGGIYNGGGYSEPLVFVGLGSSPVAERVRIEWPSGTVQEVGGLGAGQIHELVEPSAFVVEPATRHLPADGRSTATIRVTPRQSDGSLRDSARVEVVLRHGGGSVGALTPLSGGGFASTITAPSAKGSSVVEVRVDGVALGVRPRLWWD